MDLQVDVQVEVVPFENEQGSLMQLGGASPALINFVRELNEDTWFVVDGAEEATCSARGARPGETIADIVLIFLFSKVAQ